jgi:hypothetical protein
VEQSNERDVSDQTKRYLLVIDKVNAEIEKLKKAQATENNQSPKKDTPRPKRDAPQEDTPPQKGDPSPKRDALPRPKRDTPRPKRESLHIKENTPRLQEGKISEPSMTVVEGPGSQRAPIEPPWDLEDRKKLVSKLMSVSQGALGDIPLAVLEEIHEACGGSPVDEVCLLLDVKYSEGIRPDYDDGPRTWRFYVRMVESEWESRAIQAPHSDSAPSDTPSHPRKPAMSTQRLSDGPTRITGDELNDIINPKR